MSDQAFPNIPENFGYRPPADVSGDGYPCSTGLTKREYFVAKAMQGILANEGLSSAASSAGLDANKFVEMVANRSIQTADRILRELGQ